MFFTLLDLLTLIFLLYYNCSNVKKITFSNFDELQLKSVSVILRNNDFMNASHSVYLKNTKTNKIKTKIYLKTSDELLLRML